MGKKKQKAKRRRLDVIALAPDPDIPTGPACEPQHIWRQHVDDYTAGGTDGDADIVGWNPNGYL